MAYALTEMEADLAEDLCRMGVTWIARQPNGDLMAFHVRPYRQVENDTATPWVVKRSGTIQAKHAPRIVSKEREDFPRIHRTASQPTSVIDLSITYKMDHLWGVPAPVHV